MSGGSYYLSLASMVESVGGPDLSVVIRGRVN